MTCAAALMLKIDNLESAPATHDNLSADVTAEDLLKSSETPVRC